jgi:hypothetical protein
VRRISPPAAAAVLAAAVTCLPLSADELPLIEHQPGPCVVPGEPFRLCAKVSDDVGVGKARVYFRRAGDTYYAFTDMTFDGLNYCASLPAPREGRARLVEYYVQALDSAYQAQRTSTFQLQVKPVLECEFAPVEQDAARRARITVYATHAKQGRKLGDGFLDAGVTFVPVAR